MKIEPQLQDQWPHLEGLASFINRTSIIKLMHFYMMQYNVWPF